MLAAIFRDWSAAGVRVRTQLYHQGILPLIRSFYSDDASERINAWDVLVPGGGLGRLAVEIAALGMRSNSCLLSII